MIPAHLLPLTVTWQQPAATTDGNDTIDDWTDPDETDINAYIEQRTTNETTGNTNTVTTGLLFITNELGVKARHRIVWGDDVYEIDGDCATFHTPAGPHHLEASLLKVT